MPWSTTPLHGMSMVIDGDRVGIRFSGKHGTGQSGLAGDLSRGIGWPLARLLVAVLAR